MLDYGQVFSERLHEKLREKIHAGVYVKYIAGDRLLIRIIRKDENLIFERIIEQFSDKILNGYSAEYATYEILEKYRKFIFNRYFV